MVRKGVIHEPSSAYTKTIKDKDIGAKISCKSKKSNNTEIRETGEIYI